MLIWIIWIWMLIIMGISMIKLIGNHNVHHNHNVIKIVNIITVIILIRSQWKINKTELMDNNSNNKFINKGTANMAIYMRIEILILI